MKLLKPDVSIGDRFKRVGKSRTVYEVVAFLEKRGLPLHVRLVSDEGSGSQSVLISASALTDSTFFRRVVR